MPMQKKELDMDVVEKTRERMDYVFSEYDHIFVAHSAGKDSTTAFNMTMDAWERNDGHDNPIKIIHNCTEFKYPEEWDYFDEIWTQWEEELYTYWSIMPVLKSLLVNNQRTWRFPYDEREKDKWVHDIPNFNEEYSNVELVLPNHPYMRDFRIGMKHSDVAREIMEKFNEEYHDGEAKIANVTGLRAQESLDRYGAITTIGGYISEGDVFDAVHPVYDWTARDLWTATEKFDWPYNKAYDKMHQSGYAPTQARNGPMWGPYPIGAQDAYKIRNWYPELFERAERRFPGTHFAFEFGSDLFKPEKPDDMTWREFCAAVLNEEEVEEEQRESIISTIQNRMEMHWDRTNIPFQETEECPICGHSWRTLAHFAYGRINEHYKEVH